MKSPEDIPGYPQNDYLTNLRKYQELEQWFTGEALREVINTQTSAVEKFPIRINPVYRTVLKHAQSLFGEYQDDAEGPLVMPKVRKLDGSSDDTTLKYEQILEALWSDNSGSASQMRNGIFSQIYGNCVFRLAYDPFDKFLTNRLRIDHIVPYEFVGYSYPDNPWMFNEAWIIRKISRKTAAQYGYEVDQPTAYYIEKWTTMEYGIYINGDPISMVFEDEDFVFQNENPFGFVPFVQIPHIWAVDPNGDSLITDTVTGIVKEYNARFADAGDAISSDTHVTAVMKNVRGTPQVINITPNLRVINLGSTQSLTGAGDKEPGLEFPERQRLAPTIIDVLRELYSEYRREVSVPAVAEGEDEGSQRSSLTLTTRMQPLAAHIRMERINWSVALRILHRMGLIMLATIGTPGVVAEEINGLRISSRWYPILPRDREMLINELSVRSSNDLGSIAHLLDLTGDIEDVDAEIEKILAWKKQLSEATAKPEESQPESKSSSQSTAAREKKETKKASKSDK
jgi:hypothetical protein